MSTISAITSNIWINPPPILKPNPRSQSTNRTIIIVQSIMVVGLLGEDINKTAEDAPCQLQYRYFDPGHGGNAVWGGNLLRHAGFFVTEQFGDY